MTGSNPQADAAAVERAEQLILLTERLTELVVHSAQAFEARRPQDAAGLVGEPGRLANLYRHESTRIRGNPRVLAGLSLTQRTRLVRATEAFDAVLARQARAVEAAKTVTEGLVRTIAEEVASRRQKGASYGADATTAAAPAATAITLNKRA